MESNVFVWVRAVGSSSILNIFWDFKLLFKVHDFNALILVHSAQHLHDPTSNGSATAGSFLLFSDVTQEEEHGSCLNTSDRLDSES